MEKKQVIYYGRLLFYMKKIFLYAYDKVNLGDDLFIENIVKRYPKTIFYILSDNINKENFQELRNLRVINKDSFLLKKLKKIWSGGYSRYEMFVKKRCDALVYIGGSIFIEYPTWANIVNWWNYHAEHFQLYIIGANFGPYQTSEYKLGMETVFGKTQDICFRDRQSYELFHKISKVRYAPDILFSQHMKKIESQRKIFISVINCKNKDEGLHHLSQYHDSYVNTLVNIINDYLKDQYAVTLCSFCKNEGDEDTVNEINYRLNSKKIKLLFYSGKNRAEILNEISESCYIIGTRFHSIILGMNAKKPVFPIIYSQKTKNMLDDLGFKGNYIDISQISLLDYNYSKANLDNHYVIDVLRFQQESLNHFMKIDQKG